MKKNKIIIILLGVFFVLLCAIIVTQNSKNETDKSNINNELMHLKVDFEANSLENLVDNSTIIVEAEIGDKQVEFKEFDIPFVLSEVKVIDVIKGNAITKNDTIMLLQTNAYEDPIVEKGSHKLLFLEKYEGPITDDAYVCKGLYQGNYTLNEDGTISASGNFDNKIIKEITKMSKDEVKNDIKK